MIFSGYVHPDFRRVADTFQKQLPKDREGGAGLTVYHRNEIVVDIFGGTRDAKGNPWELDTLSLSFSTTKGIAATLLHVLVSKGLINYDTPVAHYWPAFAQNGKEHITVRHLLCHEAGLFHIRDLVDNASELTDWDHMLRVMEQAAPYHTPGLKSGYHGLTFGWLIGGVIEKATGKPFAEILKEELSDPLNLDGCYVGLPENEFARAATLILPKRKPAPASNTKPKGPIAKVAKAVVHKSFGVIGFDLDTTLKGLVPHGMREFDFNSPDVVKSCIPAAAGMFNSRSLAKIYAMLANNGSFNQQPIIAPQVIRKLQTLQNDSLGYVVPIPMKWRLGYHRVFTTGPKTPNAFGHFGYGGSGAWCDPTRQLAVGYTVNHGVGTPFGDLRIWQLNTQIINSTEQR